jgi:NTP pyrophosphatase (non-canonical NTP hydrolase)
MEPCFQDVKMQMANGCLMAVGCDTILKRGVMSNSRPSLAYFAGLIDSDGNINLSSRERKEGYAVFPKVSIANKNKKLLEYAALSVTQKHSLYCTNDNLWILEYNSQHAIDILSLIKDYLVLKRDRAIDILKYSIETRFTQQEIQHILSSYKEVQENEACHIDGINIRWLAGFIDGDGCFCAWRPSHSSKPKFTLAITYHQKYNDALMAVSNIFGGNIRTTKNKQWYLTLNSDKIPFLLDLYHQLYFKQAQCLMILRWLEKYPTNERDVVTSEHTDIMIEMLSSAKQGVMPIDVFQYLSGMTAIYPENMKIVYPALGLAGESGEVCEKIKKLYRDSEGKITPIIRESIKKEMSDVMWYLSALAIDLGTDLEDITVMNVQNQRS